MDTRAKRLTKFKTLGEEGLQPFSRVLIPNLIVTKAVHPHFFNNLKKKNILISHSFAAILRLFQTSVRQVFTASILQISFYKHNLKKILFRKINMFVLIAKMKVKHKSKTPNSPFLASSRI